VKTALKGLVRTGSSQAFAVRYAAAVVTVGLASLGTLAARPWMGPSISLFFFPAIVFTAMYGGYGPALLATVLSTMSLAFFFVQPYNSFDIGPDDAIRLTVFAGVAIVTASVGAARKRAEDAQRRALEELQSALDTLRKVSGWPVFADASLGGGARKVLEHAANVVGSARAVAVWEVDEEPWVYVALSAGPSDTVVRHPPTRLTPVVPEMLDGATLLCTEPLGENSAITVSLGGAIGVWHGMPVDREILDYLLGTGFASAPFRVEHLQGRAFFSGLAAVTPELIPLVEVVAREVGNSLEQLYLHDRLQQIAIREDRVRVARDLHDGVLQSLTGIRFQLQAFAGEPEATSSISDRLLAVERAIAIEQRELRLFIEDLKPAARRTGLDGPVAQSLEELRTRLGAEWKTPIVVRVTPADMSLSAPIERAVRMMVHEAIVNALKHAHPSRVSVDVQADGPDTLRIVVSDDGRGFPFKGRRGSAELTAANAGPVSLTERVDSLSGTLAIESLPTGSRIEITVPVTIQHS
jgi:signal transduction histidine kinase